MFGVLYIGQSVHTAITETLVRNHAANANFRMHRAMLSHSVVFEYNHNTALTLLDLRGDGPLRAGIDPRVIHDTDYTRSQALSKFVHDELKDIDGILYPSWHTQEDCIALYESGVDKLKFRRVTFVHQHQAIYELLGRYRIKLYGSFDDKPDNG